jgi:uncharacterized membrane protein YGL010W
VLPDVISPNVQVVMARKSADQWFDEYSVCHKNPINKLIHWVCVPLIALSLLALVWTIPVPAFLADISPWLNWATVLMVFCLTFYLFLSPKIALGMLIIAVACTGIIRFYVLSGFGPLWKASTITFVSAWIGQFIGHRIEGRKPAFIEDIQFLLIGPAWLLGAIYRRFGIRY